MKRIFLIPTWHGHFSKNIVFLKSCIDFEIKIPIKFVVSDETEKINLTNLIKELDNCEILNFEIVEIEKIIKKYKPEITLSDIEDLKLLHKKVPNIWNSKHPYQAIKKIYALRYFEYDQALLLDSECAFIKQTDVNELFDEYFENPKIFYTPHEKVHQNLRFFTDASHKCLRWMDVDESIKNMWVFENLYWMIDKTIFDDMICDIESNLKNDIYTEFSTNAGEIFDMIVYYAYIFINNKKYNYKFLNYYDIMKEYMGLEFDNYISGKNHRLGGFLEFMFENLNEKSYEFLFKFIENYKIRFCRPDFCDINLYKKAVQNSKYLNLILCSENSPEIINFLKK